MPAAGIGVDMLEISRMEQVIERRPSFLRRVFTEEERAYCERSARPAEHYAARFAAREAVLKALGTGFAQGIGLKDVSVTRDPSTGRPRALLAGRAAQIAQEQGVREIALSISHTRDVAVANALAVTDDVRPAPPSRDEAARALATSFKEARAVLDELERVQEEALGHLGGGSDRTPAADGPDSGPGPVSGPDSDSAPTPDPDPAETNPTSPEE